MHISTQRMIDYLKAAGFNRREFSVTTPRDKNKEYGSTRVTLHGKADAERIPALLAQGLTVYAFVLNGRVSHITVKTDGQKLIVRDVTEHFEAVWTMNGLTIFDFARMEMI